MNSVSAIGRFPEEACLLVNLAARAEELKAREYEGAEKLEKKMKLMMRDDPSMSKESIASSRPRRPLDANIVRLGHGRNYLLSSCPSSVEKAAMLFEVALAAHVGVFVSLLESTEAAGKCNNFWKPEVLSSLPLQNGWKIEHLESRPLMQEVTRERTVQVVKSSLKATKGDEVRNLTHLHLNGWPDGALVPSEAALFTLLDSINELQGNSETPIQINCRHGEGRTGLVAVLHALRKEIGEQLAAGKPLAEVQVNVLETTYAMKRQRKKGLLKRKEQLASVYAHTASYFQRRPN